MKSVTYKALANLHFEMQSVLEKSKNDLDAINKIADKYEITEEKAQRLIDAWCLAGQLEIVGKELGILK